MSRALVALSASAVAAVYLAGFVRTSAVDAGLGQTAAATPNQGGRTIAVAAPLPTATTATVGYRDGTYSGQGSSRRGDVWVNVDIQSGRIARVTITKSTLQYPVRDIAGLPDQVVQRQTSRVDTVSRATYSSQAFRDAVQQALSRAG
jgi:uncharacterized protein with FMN-binding domain